MIFQKRVRKCADNRFHILQITKVLTSHKNILTYNLGFQSLSGMVHLVHFVKWWQIFLELNSKRLYQSSGKENESRCLVFTSSTKREIGQFSRCSRATTAKKSVMHVQSCCFSSYPRPPQNSLRFWIPRRGLRILITGFQIFFSEIGFRIPVVNGIPDSYSCFSDSKAQDSGFHEEKFQDSGIRIPLHGEIVLPI